jgi:2-C-methyl-D-erythritol 4-phosphate cytidylyltransferase / 2-C-methyl-D-erythritol 2,4-cyclodiphosphate synthase
VLRASLIVAAGGSGSRFEKSLKQDEALKRFDPARYPSKLFIPLLGKPLLIHSLLMFHSIPEIQEVLLAVPRGLEKQVEQLLSNYKIKRVRVVRGGKTRSESILKGLEKSNARNPWVIVHDAARPFVTEGHLRKLFQAAKKADGAILAKKVVPTIKEVTNNNRINRTLNRDILFEAETPQMIRRDLIKKAYKENPNALQATDEASLVEYLNADIRVVSHEGWNPKITHYKDFELAEAMFSKGNSEIRTGMGRDIHRLVTGRKLLLGGVVIPSDKGSLGHSDGDALLHAIADALLGAIGAGDIGEWFSDQDKKNKDLPSTKIVQSVLKEVKSQGWKIENLDSTIVLEKPRLGSHKKRIRQNLMKIFSLPEDAISVKAKTMEGMGPEGQGFAVSAEAIVTIKK